MTRIDESNSEAGTHDAEGGRRRRRPLASSLLILTLLAVGGALAAWKAESLHQAGAAAAGQPEPMETVTIAVAGLREHRPTVTSIGTVLATRWVTLRNELAGTVADVRLVSGQVVDAGTVLVRLDVSVEEAELAALEARAKLAETMLERNEQAMATKAVSEIEVDRARAERDVARAEIARTQAIIARKTLRAPFRSRVGLADVYRGQYLDEGTVLTTLQGIDEKVHVDFAVAQAVAAGLAPGDTVRILTTGQTTPVEGTIVALDSRVDAATRNATVRARVEDAEGLLSPGASVRVEVPAGVGRQAVVVPVTAVRKGPAGDHLFVIVADDAGKPRAHVRAVVSGSVLPGGEMFILSGLEAGEQVASSGSFKLREGVLVVAAGEPIQAGEVKP